MKVMQTIWLMLSSLFVIVLFSGCSPNRSSTSSVTGSSTQDATIISDDSSSLSSEQTTVLSTTTAGSQVMPSTTESASSTASSPTPTMRPSQTMPTSTTTTSSVPTTSTPTASATSTTETKPTTSIETTPTQTEPSRVTEPAETSSPVEQIDYRQEMRSFVMGLSAYAKKIQPDFAVVTQNGEDIIVSGSVIHHDFLKAIDGIGREDFLFGYDDDNIATPASETKYIRSFLDIYKRYGKAVLITDYCYTTDKMQRSYDSNSHDGFVSFAADERELNRIPSYPQPIFNENANNINNLSEASNFLYLINPEHFATKKEFIDALKKTNYDLIIIDLFFNDIPLSKADVEQLKVKSNGAKRQVICYLSIGEAETYRYYWQDEWIRKPPVWLDQENPDWPGNFKVKYWDPAWQSIIFGNDQSYLGMILNANFDGTYLDIIDAFEFFEDQ